MSRDQEKYLTQELVWQLDKIIPRGLGLIVGLRHGMNNASIEARSGGNFIAQLILDINNKSGKEGLSAFADILREYGYSRAIEIIEASPCASMFANNKKKIEEQVMNQQSREERDLFETFSNIEKVAGASEEVLTSAVSILDIKSTSVPKEHGPLSKTLDMIYKGKGKRGLCEFFEAMLDLGTPSSSNVVAIVLMSPCVSLFGTQDIKSVDNNQNATKQTNATAPRHSAHQQAPAPLPVAQLPQHGGSLGGISSECCVCMDNPKNTMFEQCKHLCVCEQCASGLKRCPVCNTVGKAIKIFIA